MEPKERFVELYRKYITRDGAEAFLQFLLDSDFFTAPASARYHSSVAGGLCQHSLNVYDCLRAYMNRPRVQQVYKLVGDDYSPETSGRRWLPTTLKIPCPSATAKNRSG